MHQCAAAVIESRLITGLPAPPAPTSCDGLIHVEAHPKSRLRFDFPPEQFILSYLYSQHLVHFQVIEPPQ